jgi:hypothetical protein
VHRSKRPHPNSAAAARRRVLIVEVTYHSDHSPCGQPSFRDQPKHEQHAETVKLLQERGYEVDHLVWGLGRMGVAYREPRTAAAQQLGVEQPQRLLQDLHVHAVNMLHKIVQTRRQLERQRGYEQTRPP